MIRIGAWLERWLLLAVVAVTAAAVAVPSPGRWVDRHAGIDLVLVVLVLASGLGIPVGAGPALRRLAARLVAVVAVAAVVLPLLAELFSRVLPVGPLRDGVLAVGVAPAEVAAIGLSGLAGGDVAVAAALLAASTLVSVAAAGPILSLLTGSGVAPWHVVLQLVLVVGLPLAVGLASRRAVVRAAAARPAVAAVPGFVATLAVLLLVALVAAQVRLAVAYLTVTGVFVALIAVSAAVGGLLARLLPRPAALSALLHVSMRDFAIASGIAAAAFGPAATGPLGLYGVLVIAWGTLVATWSARRRVPVGVTGR